MSYKLPNDALEDNTIEIGKLSSSVGNALVPVGGIIMWSGSVAEAEALSNWAICDGQNGRPDLRDKFVQGVGSSAAGSTANVNDQGGANSYQLALNQMPQHKHDVSDSGHSHTITDPGHQHTWSRQDAQINAFYRPWPANNNDCVEVQANTSNETTGITGTNNGNANISESLKGGNTSIENRPAYWSLCYIMRIS
tara:strand:+ start:56 stop:640 length:585 start_codon:yes stop_codon:yes gene_type:complete